MIIRAHALKKMRELLEPIQNQVLDGNCKRKEYRNLTGQIIGIGKLWKELEPMMYDEESEE